MMYKITLDTADHGRLFAFIAKGETDHAVHIQSGNVYSQGCMAYSSFKINGTLKLIAFYNSPQNAYKAIQIYCMTRIAMEKETEKNKYPSWVKQSMLARQKMIIDKKPLFNGIVLVTNLFQTTKFFGYIDLDSYDLSLLIAVDDDNLDVPWEDFSFK